MATKKFESYEVNKYLNKQKHAPKQLIRTFDAGAKKIIGIFKVQFSMSFILTVITNSCPIIAVVTRQSYPVAHWGPNASVEFAF
jgi:hypothetical protein